MGVENEAANEGRTMNEMTKVEWVLIDTGRGYEWECCLMDGAAYRAIARGKTKAEAEDNAIRKLGARLLAEAEECLILTDE